MSEAIKHDRDIEAVKVDLAALRGDVSDLLEHLRKSAEGRTASARDELGRQFAGFGREAVEDGRDAVSLFTQWFRQRPVLATLVAVGVGYVGARALLR